MSINIFGGCYLLQGRVFCEGEIFVKFRFSRQVFKDFAGKVKVGAFFLGRGSRFSVFFFRLFIFLEKFYLPLPKFAR